MSGKPRKPRLTKAQRITQHLEQVAREAESQRQKDVDDAREAACDHLAAKLCLSACPLIAGEDRLHFGELSEDIRLAGYQNRFKVASFLLYLGYSEGAVAHVLSNKGMYGSDRMIADYWAELRDGTCKSLTKWLPRNRPISDENLIASFERSVADMVEDGMFHVHSNIVQRITGAQQDPHSEKRRRLREELDQYLSNLVKIAEDPQ